MKHRNQLSVNESEALRVAIPQNLEDIFHIWLSVTHFGELLILHCTDIPYSLLHDDHKQDYYGCNYFNYGYNYTHVLLLLSPLLHN